MANFFYDLTLTGEDGTGAAFVDARYGLDDLKKHDQVGRRLKTRHYQDYEWRYNLPASLMMALDAICGVMYKEDVQGFRAAFFEALQEGVDYRAVYSGFCACLLTDSQIGLYQHAEGEEVRELITECFELHNKAAFEAVSKNQWHAIADQALDIDQPLMSEAIIGLSVFKPESAVTNIAILYGNSKDAPQGTINIAGIKNSKAKRHFVRLLVNNFMQIVKHKNQSDMKI